MTQEPQVPAADDASRIPPAVDTTPIPIDDSPGAAGPLANLIASAAAAVLGVFGLLMSLTFTVGTPAAPGPGLWPMIVSILIVVLAVAQIVAGRRGGSGEVFVRASWMALAGLVSLAVYVAVLPYIGFEIPTLVFAVVWVRFLGHEKWLTTAITAVAIVVAFYLIFVVALSTAIPHLF